MFVSFNINAFKRNNNLFSEMQFYFCKKYSVVSFSKGCILYKKTYLARNTAASLDQGNENQESRETNDSLIHPCEELITKRKFHSS